CGDAAAVRRVECAVRPVGRDQRHRGRPRPRPDRHPVRRGVRGTARAARGRPRPDSRPRCRARGRAGAGADRLRGPAGARWAPQLSHVVYEADYTLPPGPEPGEPVTLADLAGGPLATDGPRAALAMAAHQNRDGSIMVGASRSSALREGDESAAALRDVAARA